MSEIRNVAIIAHVDHGKTTLIDSIFKQSGTFRTNQNMDERIMDSNDLEKERGITILAKCTAVEWNDFRINIIDTPGHADFGGEVERVLSMADGVILLADAAEGPMPQTKFVLSKALKLGLKPIVVVNKIDKADSRGEDVVDEIFDLFVSLDANDEQLDFPVLYASGRDGWAVTNLEEDKRENLDPLLSLITKHVHAPTNDPEAPFSMLATMLDKDNFLGRVLTGKVYGGTAKINDTVQSIDLNGNKVESFRLTKLLRFDGIERKAVDEVRAGDIVCIAGIKETTVSNTICAPDHLVPIQSTPIDPPTMAITMTVNDSPLCGREGTKLTTVMIRDRLLAEDEGNVAISVTESDNKDAYEVGGRGELQLGVLIETMRREGFEITISKPRVLLKEVDGQKLEPYEEVFIDVDDEYSGVVVEKMQMRKAEMTDMRQAIGKTRITFTAPSRGLIGYQSEFMTDTRGTGVMNRVFLEYGPYKGDIKGRRNGVLVSNADGKAVSYALFNLQDRGIMFINAQTDVYEGMVIGQHNRENDLDVNVLKGKKLTNVRASGTDEAVSLTTVRELTLEHMMSYINDDELVEVTPVCLRLRKRHLKPSDRKLAAKKVSS
jgi:GTP-binding protein